MKSDEELLRIRLEGRLEVLEEAADRLLTFLACAVSGWEERGPAIIGLVEAWLELAPTLAEARLAAQRESGAKAWLERVQHREQHLIIRLGSLLEDTAASRTQALERKLELWAELARSLGPVTAGEPLATGEGVHRSREWWVTFGAAAVVVALRQPLLALLLAPIGVVWWDFCKRVTKWRMFKDCLEIAEPERPVRRIPLASVERVEDHRLLALWDLSLKGESGFLEFAVDLRRVLTERQARARFEDRPAPAMWLPASVHVGEPARASHGWVLGTENGVVFVPDSAIALAWFAAVGAPPLDPATNLGAELRSLPAGLLAAKVNELSKLRGCSLLNVLHRSAFQSLGDILLIVMAPDKKLFVRCSLSSQAKLQELL